jgi:hypothetical protein
MLPDGANFSPGKGSAAQRRRVQREAPCADLSNDGDRPRRIESSLPPHRASIPVWSLKVKGRPGKCTPSCDLSFEALAKQEAPQERSRTIRPPRRFGIPQTPLHTFQKASNWLHAQGDAGVIQSSGSPWNHHTELSVSHMQGAVQSSPPV